MNTQMDPTPALGLTSRSQIARRLSETWAGANLYCLACNFDQIEPTPRNTEAVDFVCKGCSAPYQLKAMRKWNERRVPDAGYDAMVRALRSDSVPNLAVMQYLDDWTVHNLLIVPAFFFSLAAVQRRKPLAQTARRAGWVGCNILLSEIADDGKIRVISQGVPLPPQEVREEYARVRPFGNIGAKSRGWTLDVLHMIRQIGKSRFCLDDVYTCEKHLSTIYPGNRNVRPKIRQQLQVLRDLGFLAFEGHGRYRMLQ